jgi:copper chaperone
MAKVVLTVPDISCEHCERTVTQALTALDGIRTVNVSIPAKQVRVEYDDGVASLDRMQAALQEEDYPVESVQTA